jgi:ribosomal protein S18 acetylase RimI-like enzyme
MVIRIARPDELPDVTALLSAQFEEHGVAHDGEGLRSAARGVIEHPSRGTFLVARDTDPIGLAYLAYIWTLEHGGKTAWLEELYVIPAMRSRGIGSALLREAIARADAEQCRAIDLEVDDEHARAADLYARAGFRRLARSRWYAKLSDR